MSTRNRRVGELIRQELAGLLRERLRDPRLKEVTITEVEMSPDLKVAKVYFACASDQAKAVAEGLDKAAGFIRRELAQKIYLKYMPALVYRYDKSLDQGQAMDSLLESLAQDGPGEETPEKAS